MTGKHIDTQAICDKLEQTKFSRTQASAISSLLKDHDDGYHENFVTKTDLKNFGNELILKIVGYTVGIILTLITAIGGIVILIKPDEKEPQFAAAQPVISYGQIEPSAAPPPLPAETSPPIAPHTSPTNEIIYQLSK